MHASDEGESSEFRPVEANSWVEVVSVQMKRGTEKVGSIDDDGSREVVRILMIVGFGSREHDIVVVSFFEDRFGEAAVD